MKTESAQVRIREAVLISPGSVRLRIISEKDYKERKGNVAGRWYEFPDEGAREAFKSSGLVKARRMLAIPARATLGSDTVVSLTIEWDWHFQHREKLLTHWVMTA